MPLDAEVLDLLRFHATRPKGLCWTCYYTPDVRKRFASTSKFAHKGSGLEGSGFKDCKGLCLPDVPTAAPPGSPEKVAVLEARAAAGVALWHPLDAAMDPESADLDICA